MCTPSGSEHTFRHVNTHHRDATVSQEGRNTARPAPNVGYSTSRPVPDQLSEGEEEGPVESRLRNWADFSPDELDILRHGSVIHSSS